MFQDLIGEVQQFAHDGGNNDLGGFMACFEAVGKGFEQRIEAYGGDGWLVENAPNGGFVDLGELRTVAHRIAGLMLFGRETGSDRGGAHIFVVEEVMEFSEEFLGGMDANAWDGTQQSFIVA